MSTFAGRHAAAGSGAGWGGVSPFAAKKRIQLRRVDKAGNEKVYKFDLDAIERGEAGGGATRSHGRRRDRHPAAQTVRVIA